MESTATHDMGSVFVTRPWDKHWSSDMLAGPDPIRETLLERFDEQVAARPDSPFVSYFSTTLSLREVSEAADGVAAEFAESGIGAGDRVALLLQNQPEFVIATLAAWKVGAIAVPVNPMYRERELEHLLGDSGARAIVALDELQKQFVEPIKAKTSLQTVIVTDGFHYLPQGEDIPEVLTKARVVQVDGAVRLADVVAGRRGHRPEPYRPAGDDVAFLCYTSGTTGPPKGAMVTHSGLVFSAQNFVRMRGLDSSDVIYAVAPVFHITGIVCTVAVGLLEGMQMVLAYRFDVGTALQLVERYRATFTVAATTAFIALLDDPRFGDHDISSLRKVICGGSPLPPAVLDRYRDATGVFLHNGYGLTEATSPTFGTPTGTVSPVDPETGALALGVPLPGTDCRLVDDAGDEIGIGQPGEIVVRGPHVVAGYWNNPAETAAAIQDGWLRTGDVATMSADGWFFMVDRKKDQINASGFKVWPREVEDVLYQHPDIREAAVVGVAHRYRGETVRAVVSLRPGSTLTDAGVAAFCRDKLAAYKVPTEVLILDELPKTASGKILRRSLRDTDPAS
jgi:long-chain acyl-CoA synthetase